MAASPEWKVHNAAGEYKACCKDIEDAGVLAELYGIGACIKNRGWGSKPLYVVRDMIGPDMIAREVFRRCDELSAEAARKRAGVKAKPLGMFLNERAAKPLS